MKYVFDTSSLKERGQKQHDVLRSRTATTLEMGAI